MSHLPLVTTLFERQYLRQEGLADGMDEAAREYGRVRDLYWDRLGRRFIGEGTEGPTRLRNALVLLRRYMAFYRSYLLDAVRPRLVETIAVLEKGLRIDGD